MQQVQQVSPSSLKQGLDSYPTLDPNSLRFDVQADDVGKPVAVAVKPVLGRKQRTWLWQLMW